MRRTRAETPGGEDWKAKGVLRHVRALKKQRQAAQMAVQQKWCGAHRDSATRIEPKRPYDYELIELGNRGMAMPQDLLVPQRPLQRRLHWHLVALRPGSDSPTQSAQSGRGLQEVVESQGVTVDGGVLLMDKLSAERLDRLLGGLACKKGVTCATSGVERLCRARRIGTDDLLECLEDERNCTFATRLGRFWMCGCPVRLHLYVQMEA